MKIETGLRCKVAGTLGTITKVDGGIVYITTPHGSVIRSGLLFVFPLTREEEERLQEYEIDATGVRLKQRWPSIN